MMSSLGLPIQDVLALADSDMDAFIEISCLAPGLQTPRLTFQLHLIDWTFAPDLIFVPLPLLVRSLLHCFLALSPTVPMVPLFIGGPFT